MSTSCRYAFPAGTDLDHFEVFPWNRNLETGQPLIDEQHRTLVGLLNRLGKTLINKKRVEVNDAFDELADYADRHFKEEEAVWTRYFKEDAWLTSHQRGHAAFLPQVIEIKTRDADKPLADQVEQIIKFLIRWLAFHIIDDDKRMAIVVEALEAGTPLEAAKEIAEKKMGGSMLVLIETLLTMYDGLSSRAIQLMRERHARIKAEQELRQANKRLEALAITDVLTGLYNRRYFEKVFQTEIRRARRYKQALVFLLIDIDFFKQFNDTYGHLAGDSALTQISRRLLETCRRPGDLVFRLGGEEFGVLASNPSDKNPGAFGEIIRAAVEALKIPHSHSNAGEYVTISIGLVNKVPAPDDTIDSYTEIADKRLYRAKASGRNCVVYDD